MDQQNYIPYPGSGNVPQEPQAPAYTPAEHVYFAPEETQPHRQEPQAPSYAPQANQAPYAPSYPQEQPYYPPAQPPYRQEPQAPSYNPQANQVPYAPQEPYQPYQQPSYPAQPDPFAPYGAQYGTQPFGAYITPEMEKGKKQGLAAFILGLSSLVCHLLSISLIDAFRFFGLAALVTGIIGVVMGASSRKKLTENNGLGLAGLVLSIVSLVICVLIFTIIMSVATVFSGVGSYY